MISKLFAQFIKHKIAASMILLVVAGGGYWGYSKIFSNDGAIRYATAQVQNGTLIVSISGSGQVSASDQVDIKPKVSGELTAFYVTRDQEIKAGQLLAVIDARAAQRTVNEGEVSLESAKIALEKLLSPPDAQSLLTAQNALAQAERDYEKAKRTYENIETDAEQTLSNAYENGYSDVSTSFFRLSGYIKDLKDAMGTDSQEQEHVSSYRIVLGVDSPLVQRFVDDYYRAASKYQTTFRFFEGVFRNSDREDVYKLINDTLDTADAISRALESARHMYDAIVTNPIGYRKYFISSTVDSMKPKIENDLSGIFSTINSLRNTINTIDDTVQNTPDKIIDAELALKSAEERLASRKLALEELEADADSLDIRTQQNIVAQREASLANAKADLANHYVYAPFGGVVAQTNSNIRKGDNVSSGSVLATLITKQKIAEITLNEIDIARVKTGQKATITFDAVSDLTITGQIVEVDALGTISQGVVTYKVKIAFDTQDDRVKTAMSVSAAIVTEAKPNVVLVPNSAVKSQGGMSYVEIVDGDDRNLALAANASGAILKNSPRRQNIEVGAASDEFTEIISGLNEGDLIVTRTIQPTTQTTQTQQQSGGLRIPGFNTGGGGGGSRGGFTAPAR